MYSSRSFVARQENYRRRMWAQLNGEMKYESVFPCPKGHKLRYASNAQCTECSAAGVERRRARNVQGN